MGKRGPKPAPSALKLLLGTRADRINPEPDLPPGAPEPPEYVNLDKAAREYWAEMVPVVLKLGVFTEADRHAFGLLCTSYSRWLKDKNNQHYRDDFRRLLAEFGLTPSGRSGLKVPAAGPKDELGEFLSKRKA